MLLLLLLLRTQLRGRGRLRLWLLNGQRIGTVRSRRRLWRVGLHVIDLRALGVCVRIPVLLLLRLSLGLWLCLGLRLRRTLIASLRP